MYAVLSMLFLKKCPHLKYLYCAYRIIKENTQPHWVHFDSFQWYAIIVVSLLHNTGKCLSLVLVCQLCVWFCDSRVSGVGVWLCDSCLCGRREQSHDGSDQRSTETALTEANDNMEFLGGHHSTESQVRC